MIKDNGSGFGRGRHCGLQLEKCYGFEPEGWKTSLFVIVSEH